MCSTDPSETRKYYDALPAVVEEMLASCKNGESLSHMETVPIPSQESVIELIHQARRILFPGYFSPTMLTPSSIEYYLGQETTSFFEAISRQITSAVQHDCFRLELSCANCEERGYKTALAFIKTLPAIQRLLNADIKATLEGDPAAKGYDEVIFSYPGLFAISVARLAHELYLLQVPVIPRIMTEYAHSKTGIDIHPGATIGESFFIDHGTGVVIGETTKIGKNVRIYQGVTLGALSLPRDAGDLYRDVKRHPTIEDDVIIYANSTILGGDTVIGARSVIGGNIWITASVPPNTKVLLKKPELVYTGKKTAPSA